MMEFCLSAVAFSQNTDLVIGSHLSEGFPHKGQTFLLPEGDSNLGSSLVAARAIDGCFSTIKNPLFSYFFKFMNSWLVGQTLLLQQSFLSGGGLMSQFPL